MRTKDFKQLVLCPDCGHRHTPETGFNRWMRQRPELDSIQEGIMRFDCDVLLHRYGWRTVKGMDRRIQFLMFIEVKTFEAKPDIGQQDTLSLFAQALRNQRDNRHKKKNGRQLRNHKAPTKGFSILHNEWVTLRMFGAHLLTFQRNDPSDGWMKWNGKKLKNIDELLGLLRFEINPYTLLTMDLRVHHADAGLIIEPSLFA